ncbi:MAG: flippase-like domain-containing protein [Dehalococcoidia bacterium]|nr:flippase-like domain-containing protein [Dehalococcoidia bacterium]
MMRGKRGFVLKAAISSGLLALLLTRSPLAELGASLTGSDLLLLVLAFGVGFGGWFIANLKWQRLLGALGSSAPYSDLFALNLIGVFYSLVLPGQVSGEIVKGVRLSQFGVQRAAVATSILLDRLTGLAALALAGLVGLALTPGSPFAGAAVWIALVVLGGSALPVLLARKRLPFAPTKAAGLYAKVWLAASALNDALLTYRGRPLVLAEALLLALLFQASVYGANYMVVVSVGAPLSLAALLWIVSTVSLLNLLPITLGGLGVREGAYALLLEQQGVPFSQGLAISLIASGMFLLLGSIGGVLEAGLYRALAGPKPANVS